jgi:hypothetical protein
MAFWSKSPVPSTVEPINSTPSTTTSESKKTRKGRIKNEVNFYSIAELTNLVEKVKSLNGTVAPTIMARNLKLAPSTLNKLADSNGIELIYEARKVRGVAFTKTEQKEDFINGMLRNEFCSKYDCSRQIYYMFRKDFLKDRLNRAVSNLNDKLITEEQFRAIIK